ncbi:hypothetical protein NEMBOFW57_005380 [Staphylotrichum longicolle]|uniref:Ribonucleases P/MRP subunit Pop8-like domain-containing protein n=1 Tax=Staphylotrichum longicolle TaxID=669026 RepID=A0AAD4EWV3_9PEZI|nr:hypothetical protein NEMBOFW57_005380 [Staphylotrichum longicolle]
MATTTDPDSMDLDPTPTKTTKTTTKTRPAPTTLTLKNPPFAYAHLTLLNPPTTTSSASSSTAPTHTLDALQVRSYLTTALRQFLGDTGAAIPVDILRLEPHAAWVRVPRADLAAFAAGVTAFGGITGTGKGRGRGRAAEDAGVEALGDWGGAGWEGGGGEVWC